MKRGTRVRVCNMFDMPKFNGLSGTVADTDNEGAACALDNGFVFYFFFDELEVINE